MATKITDPNKLKELQDKREQLYGSMTSYHTENAATWTPENEAAFSAMNTEYDAVYSQIESHIEACKEDDQRQAAADARAERLQKLAQHGLRLPGNVLNAMRSGSSGSGSGFGVGENQFNDGPLRGMNASQVGALAVAAWMKGEEAAGDARMMAACQAVGTRPGDKSLRIDLMNTFDRNLAMAEYQAGLMSGNSAEGLRRAQNTLTTGTGSSGGYTFGTTFITSLEIAMTSASGMMETAEIIRTDNGDLMSWPSMDDTSNRGRLVSESGASTPTDPTFSQTQWSAYKLGSDHIVVPQELLDDNQVNLASALPAALGGRLGRGVNYYCTLGNAASQPNGIVPASTLGVTAAGATAITYDEIINLEHSVIRSLRTKPGVGYMFNDTTLLLLRKLKDADNNYLWQNGNNSGVADRINNRPYTINDHMADPTASQKSVLFGVLPSYKIRMVREVRFYRLTELQRLNDQDVFVAFLRFDGNLLDPGDHPVKHLIQHA